MIETKPIITPLAITLTLTLHSATVLQDLAEYRTIVGGLQYLSSTQPQIAYVANKLSQFMHQPTTDHWVAIKRLLCYLSGIINHGILLHHQSNLPHHAFSDVDWASNKDDYTSTSVYLVYLGRKPISWSSKKQHTLARSSTEAGYRLVASIAVELRWICSLLTELGVVLP